MNDSKCIVQISSVWARLRAWARLRVWARWDYYEGGRCSLDALGPLRLTEMALSLIHI